MHPSASQSLLHRRPSRALPFILLSVVAHVLLAVGGIVLSWVLEGRRIDLDAQPIKASLVRLGKERDEKLLPRKEEEPPPAPKPEEPVPIPTVAPKPVDKFPSTKPVEKKKSLMEAFSKTAKAAKPQELEGRTDGDVQGDSAVQEGERYFGLLKAQTSRFYDVSNTIPEAERRTLRADVSIQIGAHGQLLHAKLVKGSGNELFDDAVVGAVKRAAPFSPPPDGLRDQVKKGVTLRFTP
jgi:TonB family protein